MHADPGAQKALLQIAELDKQAAQLRHRKATLPGNVELKELATRRARLGEQIVAVQTRISDAEVDQARVESDLTPARARLERNRKTIDEGKIGAKALRAMIDETDHLLGRISNLEDQELDVMQIVEDATADRDRLTTERAQVEDEMRGLLATRDVKAREVDAELTGLETRRTVQVGKLPADLVALYERIAARSGTGAAELRGRRCGGCGLELDNTELKRIASASADEVVTCEECGRILVR